MEERVIIWTPEASADIFEIVGFVKNVSVESASMLSKELHEAVESLKTFPERYPVFFHIKLLNISVRKCVVNKRYLVLYYVYCDKIMIGRILDSRRRFGSLL